jgi:hypothetical protein
MKAYLMHRDDNPAYGVTEWWKTEDGKVLYVDFNASICETMVFPYDLKRSRVKSWNELGVWHKDMTGGKAIQKLGYEPVEEGGHAAD